MSYRLLPKCLLCGNHDLIKFLDLGCQPLSGVFPAEGDEDPPSTPLVLMRCADSECGNVQLSAIADIDSMYGQTYGYFSGISPMMERHLAGIASEIRQIAIPEEGDAFLDVGCNDGTLLNNFSGCGYKLYGIDPSAEKFQDRHAEEIQSKFDFFSAKSIEDWLGDTKFKVISSIAMFYDLEEPQDFVNGIASLLENDGVWIVELADLDLFLRNLTYDQICHEHLLYLGVDQMVSLGRKAGLKLFELSKNEINGGSFRLWFAHEASERFNDISGKVAFKASAYQLDQFSRRVIEHKHQVRHFMNILKQSEKTIAGYGASTKGNIVLHHCGITAEDLLFISDRNPEKDGRVTPGTRIPMLSREEGRMRSPDYFIVLCWHFRTEVITDEMEYLENGGTLIFLLPRIHIVTKNNCEHYLNTDFNDLAFDING